MPFVFHIPQVNRADASSQNIKEQFSRAAIGCPHTVEIVEHAQASPDSCMAFVHIDTPAGELWLYNCTDYLRKASDPCQIAKLKLRDDRYNYTGGYWILNESTKSRSAHLANANAYLLPGESCLDADSLTGLSDRPRMLQAADEHALAKELLDRLNCSGTREQWTAYYNAELGQVRN